MAIVCMLDLVDTLSCYRIWMVGTMFDLQFCTACDTREMRNFFCVRSSIWFYIMQSDQCLNIKNLLFKFFMVFELNWIFFFGTSWIEFAYLYFHLVATSLLGIEIFIQFHTFRQDKTEFIWGSCPAGFWIDDIFYDIILNICKWCKWKYWWSGMWNEWKVKYGFT